MGRMGQAEEVAKVLCFLLSDNASYVTGGKFTKALSLLITEPLQHIGTSMEAIWPVDWSITTNTGPALESVV